MENKQTITCAICEKKLKNPDAAQSAELSNTDGKYYKNGIPDGHVSQGWVEVGSDCFKKLKH